MATDSQHSGNFPEGKAYERFNRRRHRLGTFWLIMFILATSVGIVALSALLINTINDSFGYVAIQNNIDADDLITLYWKDQVLAAPRQFNSEDDSELAEGVAARPTAIGFFGHAFFQAYEEQLRALSVDGVEPTAETVESGEYLLSRPLFIYTAQRFLLDKPQVAAFIYHYLTNVNEVISDIGYYPVSDDVLAEGLEQWMLATGQTSTTLDSLLPVEGPILTAGSSTVSPLTQSMLEMFRSIGWSGEGTVDSIGTSAGFDQFCIEGATDIANASRVISRVELSACRKRSLIEPLVFLVGGDGVTVVVSEQNEFLSAASKEQLRLIFTSADKWSDVDASWPEKPVLRFVPSADSGTLDFFVEQVFGTTLEEQDRETLMALMGEHLSTGRVRALDADSPLDARTLEELIEIIEAEIVQPKIVATWTLFESIFDRSEIEAAVAQIPNAELEFKSWVSWEFITSPQSSNPEQAGIRTAILGSLWVTFIAFLVAVPIGVGAAIYLEEYGTGSRFDQIIETNINNLAGVPSIIYGILGLAVFVRALEPLTSGAMFGLTDPTTANGRTVLSGGLTLGLLILPLVIINAREAIRAVPKSLREASYGIGATKWQTIWNHVLPNAISGILTGVILAVSRAFGETAPLIVVGVSTFIIVDPDSPFSKFTTLTAQIYQWTSRPQQEFQHLAAAGIIALLILLLAINAAAIILRNHYSRRI